MRSIHVLRKPCSEPTVAANVLRHGTGAVNVDTCRTSGVGQANGNGGGSGAGQYDERGSGRVRTGINPYSGTLGGKVVDPHPVGRWPANLILQHLDGCVQDGVRKVKGQNPQYANEGRGAGKSGRVYGVGPRPAGIGIGHADPDGTETVAAWTCAEGCPVAALDEQSLAGGMHGAGKACAVVAEGAVNASSFDMGGSRVVYRFGDTGGASRFFKQVKP